VIDAVTGLPIQHTKFINKYVVKVESHRAIMEADYFIKAIEHAEAQRTLEIERIESGLGNEEEEARKTELQNSEWDKLQQSSNDEYLMKTILPVLY
jgi:nitrate/TMAO reductase-like tetraheme cytochrome c subunit